MKYGDLITANPTLKGTLLIHDSFVTSGMTNNVYYPGTKKEVMFFCNGDYAIITGFNPKDLSVKLFYQSAFWWANISEIIKINL